MIIININICMNKIFIYQSSIKDLSYNNNNISIKTYITNVYNKYQSSMN